MYSDTVMYMTVRAERVGLVAGMVLATANIWIGAPIAGLWIGSRVAPSSGISMLAVATVAVVIGAIAFALVRVLALLEFHYEELTGTGSHVRRQTPWLRSMRGERVQDVHQRTHLTPLEIILVIAVVLAVGGYEVWFFFFAGSPLDQRTGRS